MPLLRSADRADRRRCSGVARLALTIAGLALSPGLFCGSSCRPRGGQLWVELRD
jgi:hypothetical protein